METATITLERKANRWTDRLRAYKVVVDGEVAGTIRHGETETFDVPAGRHTLQLRIDWARSPTLELDLPAGGDVRLRCRPHNPYVALFIGVFARSRYVILERV